MLTVANPIYDIVFKYLLEDEQLAAQQETIRLSVKLLIGAGMSPEAVAVNLNIDVETVKQMVTQ